MDDGAENSGLVLSLIDWIRIAYDFLGEPKFTSGSVYRVTKSCSFSYEALVLSLENWLIF